MLHSIEDEGRKKPKRTTHGLDLHAEYNSMMQPNNKQKGRSDKVCRITF